MRSLQCRDADPATAAGASPEAPSIADAAAALEAEFAAIAEWNDRLKHLLSRAESLPALADDLKTEDNRVLGCQSRVWLVARADSSDGRLHFAADSDARIMRGLLALVLSLYSGRRPAEIAAHPPAFFDSLSFGRQLVPARASGLTRIVERIQAAAQDQAQAEDMQR